MMKHALPLLIALATGCNSTKTPVESREAKPKDTPKVTTQATPKTTSQKKVVKPKKTQPAVPYFSSAPYKNTKEIKKYFKELQKSFKRYGWGKVPATKYPWEHVRNSVKGRPLLWTVFGDESAGPKNTTLIMCGVHGDEITPVKFCFDVLKHFNYHPEDYKDKLVVVAPVVNPDSFLLRRPSRLNARGVDINRNFPTKDWARNAIRLWKERYKQNKRRYPGRYAMSEPEVLFQVNLIKRYRPAKVISVHAPLTLLDYDGPSFGGRAASPMGKRAKELLIKMSQKANGYKVANYPYYTGSLGNWAGNERNIPTFTLELPNTDYTKSRRYWLMFKEAIHYAVTHDLHAVGTKVSDVTSNEKTPGS